MASIINRYRSSSPPNAAAEVSVPLRNMRSSGETPLNDESRKDFEDEDDIDDFDPLLASAEGTLERVKAEIEYELGVARADTIYEREYKFLIGVSNSRISKCMLRILWRNVLKVLEPSKYG